MFHEFPYTNFSEMNLDWLICACKKNEGLHLAIVGDTLRLLNGNNEVISNVTISYAEKALTDVDGRNIETYIISAGVAGDTLVFTRGDQVVSTITVPYAEKAKYDIYHNELTDYVLNVQVVGDKLRITKGDTTVAEITVPFATKADQDVDGNEIKTYACDLTVDGQNIQLRDRAGRVLSAITVPFAVEASHALDADDALHADDADHADEADHALDADAADYATLSTDATNAIESVVISGDQVIFTTFGGTQTTITSPYAVKAQKDDIGNVIKTTYVAGVSTNAGTGEISFLDALGNVITTIIPQVEIAKKDTYNNLIADYVKTIVTDSNSNYMTVTHGTGNTDSVLINYSTHALDDINDQAIHNTYITYLECIEDVDDGHYKIVAYNGDTPKAELFRFEVIAYMAQCDVNGKALTSYVADVDINANKEVVVKDGEGNTLNTFDTIKNALTANTAINAQKDVNNKNITSYIGSLDTSAEAPRILSKDGTGTVVDSIEVPQIQVYVSSSVDPWTMNNKNFSANDVDINYSDGYMVLQTISDDAEVVLSYNANMYFAKAKSQYPDANGRTHTIFESELTASGVWQIDLVTTSLGAFHSCTGNVISAGGGGGGGSVTTYYLYSEWGQPATFATLSSASTCVLKDSNSNNVTISTLATAFAAGTVYIQDADGALTRAITLGYSNGSVSYFVMLMPNNTASAKLRSCNWQSNKYMMLDVTL